MSEQCRNLQSERMNLETKQNKNKNVRRNNNYRYKILNIRRQILSFYKS